MPFSAWASDLLDIPRFPTTVKSLFNVAPRKPSSHCRSLKRSLHSQSAAQMEAHSLASLNRLAANPPAYPRNPSEELKEALTLYISRVPGTRDIILSPFKPQLKNVTGEDVASCLYYVHLEMPPEGIAGPAPLRDDGTRRSSDEASSIRTIHRKPLPESALPLVSEGPPPNAPPQLHRRPVSLASTRGDQVSYHGRQRGISVGSVDEPSLTARNMTDLGLGPDLSHLSPPSAAKVSTRKPLGPRSMATPFSEPLDDLPPLLPPRELRQDSAPVSPVFENVCVRDFARTQDRPPTHRHSRSLSPANRDSIMSTAFTLNLIRRDPGTSSQWNVGKISSHQLDPGPTQLLATDHLAGADPAPTQHPLINIQIETSGYARFRNAPIREGIDLSNITAAQFRAAFDSGAPTCFSRQVTMAYSKSWTSNLKDKIHSASRKREHGRSQSLASIGAVGPGSACPDAHSQDKMKPRGYTFQSPWGKRCEFRTGNGGRSVLCRHILNDSPTMAYNPLVAEPPQPPSVVVSDLRFNLPGADLFSPAEGIKEGKDNRLGHFGKLIKSAVDDTFISPFDVNIGGEKAGGGSHGSRAKLGKLIVYHDGLKMLDLLVAANVGIWWETWEKGF